MNNLKSYTLGIGNHLFKSRISNLLFLSNIESSTATKNINTGFNFLSKTSLLIFVLLLLCSTLSVQAVTYYSGGNGTPTNLNNWWTNTNGTGSHPSNFTTNGDVFIIQSIHVMVTSANWTVGNGASDNVVTLQINGNLNIAGNNDVVTISQYSVISFNSQTQISIRNTGQGATFTLSDNATLRTINASGVLGTSCSLPTPTIPIKVNLSTNANYEFIGGSQTMLGLPATINDLIISGSGTKLLTATTSVNGTLTAASENILDLSTFNITANSVILNCGSGIGSTIMGNGTLSLGGNISLPSGTGTSVGALISCPVALSETPIITVADDEGTETELTIDGVISGDFGIIKDGSGLILLSGSNSYTGVTRINAGTLMLGAPGKDTGIGPLGTIAEGTIVGSGAVLDLNGFSLILEEPLTLNGTGNNNGTGALTNSSETNVDFYGPVTLGSSSCIGGIGNINATGVIAGLNLDLDKVGTGILKLSGNNTFDGGLTITSGTLEIGSDNCLDDELPVTLDGGILSTGSGIGFTDKVGTLTLVNNSRINLGSGEHTLTFDDSHTITWGGTELNITGWIGLNGLEGTAGKIFVGVGGLFLDQLGIINFSGYGIGAKILEGGELVPGSASNDYRTHAAGDWDDTNIWDFFNGTDWIYPATNPPTSANNVITILHEVSIPDNVTATANMLVIATSGNLTINSNTDELADLTATQITNNGSLTVTQKGRATVNTLTNHGSLTLESFEEGTASLIMDSYTIDGSENIQLFLTGNETAGAYPWHYISTPVQSLPTSTFTGTTLDLAQFVESLPVALDPPNWQYGWVGYDGWSYYDGSNISEYEFESTGLLSGRGYNYYHTADHPYSLSGLINTSHPGININCSLGDLNWTGYNLLGNPYTCGLDIETMFENVDYPWPSNALKAVWFTSNGVSYTYARDGIGIPSNTVGFIPPMQGFFVKTTASETFHFPLDARVHTSVSRYKGDRSSIPLVRLSISESGKSEETVIRFNEKATPDLDMNFDAPRFISSSNTPSIYTSVDDIDYTINGLPFPVTSVEIPVTIKLLTEGNHTITAMQLQELGNFQVTLTDKSSNLTIDLKSVKDYVFTASAGLIKDRFVLTVTNISTGIEDPVNTENSFNIYHGFGLINIQPLADEWDGKTGSIKVMDLSGKTVRLQQKTEFRNNTLIQFPAPVPGGLYFIEIRSGIMKYVGKVVIR